MTNTRWRKIGLLLFLIYLVCFADRTNISVAAPAIAHDFGFNSSILGTLLSAFFWGYVLTQLPGGWIASRIGPKRVIVVAMLVIGITACLTGVAQNLTQLLIIRFIMGLAEGVVWPCFAIMFVNWFVASERGRAVSLAQYTLPLSSVIMAPIAGKLIASVHWHRMFIVQGLPAIILAIAFWLTASDDPVTDGWLAQPERDFILAHRSDQIIADGRFVDVMRRPIVWGFCAAYFLWITGMYAFGMWAPTVLKQLSSTITIGAVGWLTALPYACAAIAMYFVSVAADRTTIPRGVFVGGALGLAGLALLGEHFVASSITLNMVMLTGACVGIFAGGGAWWSWALSNVPRNQAGPAMGLINLFGNFGGICGPIFVGFAAHGGKATSGLYLIGFALLVAAGMVILFAVFGPESRAAVFKQS